ncbi:MAG: ASCH domain-containing protein [Rhodospirillaceae bacterium]|nr:ASCH domain-containing protein [Rhodospirillaceae bacterium]
MSDIPKPTPAKPEAITAFLDACRAAMPHERIGAQARPRCIGLNAETAATILNIVAAGNKTGTFSLVWLHEKKPETRPYIAEQVVLCDYAGNPKILLRTTGLELVAWRDIGPGHTALDGPSMRDVTAWRKVHWQLWSGQLAAVGLTASEDMPVCVERFKVVYPKIPTTVI